MFWGVVVAIVQTAARVNESAAGLDASTTPRSRRDRSSLSMAAVAIAELAVNVVLFSLSFMAAESLTRRAFPNHPQFWRIWGRQAGASRRDPRSYGDSGIPARIDLRCLRSRVVFRGHQFAGLVDVRPRRSSIPTCSRRTRRGSRRLRESFQAGFWEEALLPRRTRLRVPPSSATVSANRRLWIVIGVHRAGDHFRRRTCTLSDAARATPGRSSSILPSIGFGLLYLTFGLLPGIVLHFAFDAFWFAMPLFATTAAGILRAADRMIVAMIFVPLWIVLIRRIMAPGVPEDVPRNASWHPASSMPPRRRSGLRPRRAAWHRRTSGG